MVVFCVSAALRSFGDCKVASAYSTHMSNARYDLFLHTSVRGFHAALIAAKQSAFLCKERPVMPNPRSARSAMFAGAGKRILMKVTAPLLIFAQLVSPR